MKRMFFLCVLMLLFLSGCEFRIVPALTPTWYVTTSGNDANDCRSEARACRTIQAAIDKADPGGLVLIGPGRYAASDQNAAARGAIIVITKRIIVRPLRPERGSGGVDLYGEDAYPGIWVREGGDLEIEGVFVRRSGGEAPSRGAIPRGVGVIVQGGQLTMRNSLISEHQYAGLYNADGVANLWAVQVVNNGGARYGGWGGIINNGSLLLMGSLVQGNQGVGLSNTGIADIADTTFDGILIAPHPWTLRSTVRQFKIA